MDECIQEKACVWYAFALQTGLINSKNIPVKDNYIHKWKGTILFLATGNGKEYLPNLVKASEELGIFFPHGMRVDKNPKNWVIFSDNVEKSIEMVKPNFIKAIGAELANQTFKTAKEYYKGCLSVHLEYKQTPDIFSNLTIIDINSEHANYCTITSFYGAYGLVGYIEEQPFSFLSNASNKGVEFTKLDKFLLHLLYRPEFQSGQGIEQVKTIFNEIYEASKQNYLAMINGEK